jgi:hypothetical protein
VTFATWPAAAQWRGDEHTKGHTMNERSTGGFPRTNQMVVVGRLTADPELKFVGDNETAKVEFRLAVDNGRDRSAGRRPGRGVSR